MYTEANRKWPTQCWRALPSMQKGTSIIADVGNQRVVEETVPPGYSYVQSVVATGIANPRWIAVDGAGNVYIADGAIGQQTGNGILKETPGPDGYTSTTLFSGRSFIGLAADAAGDLYSVDLATYYLLKLTPSGGSISREHCRRPISRKGVRNRRRCSRQKPQMFIFSMTMTRALSEYTPSGSTYISKGLGVANGASRACGGWEWQCLLRSRWGGR